MIGVGEERIWEGSIVAWRGAMPVYPAMRKEEDRVAMDWLARCHPCTMILGNPALCLYTATGRNTWSAEHFEKVFRHATAIYRGEDYTQLVEALQARVPILQYRDEIARLSDALR